MSVGNRNFEDNSGTGSVGMARARREAGMMDFRRRLATAAMLALLLSSPAFAHPGHGREGGDWSALHYLIEPAHLLFAVPMLLLAALAAGYLTRVRRLRQRPHEVKYREG